MPQKDLVLCVDDEPTLLRTLSIVVPRAGFRVAVAENGAAGLEAFARLKDEVCLVLADVVMPVMSGVDMAREILQLEPHMKILLMSAYSEEVIGRQVRRSGLPLVRKPFNLTRLVQEIQSIVAGEKAPITLVECSAQSNRRTSSPRGVRLSKRSLRTSIDETVLPVVIAGQGENRN